MSDTPNGGPKNPSGWAGLVEADSETGDTELPPGPASLSPSGDLPDSAAFPDFSTEVLEQKLPAETGPSVAPQDVAWTRADKLKVLRSAVLALALVGGGAYYSLKGQAPEPQPKPRKKLPAQTLRAPAMAPKTERAAPREKGTEAARQPAVRMISIVSQPLGAKVEIDGTIYGKTPFIQPSPKGKAMLSVRLLMDGHKIWRETLTPDESGHFSATAKLSPSR